MLIKICGHGSFPGLRLQGFPARLTPLAMQSLDSSTRRGDGHLWVIALGLSVLTNLAILASVGFAALETAKLRQKSTHPPAPPQQAVAMIFPEVADSRAAAAIQLATQSSATMGNRFARTSVDQSAPRPEQPAFFGERDTRATSDRTPDPSAPPMPSQAGIAPKDEMDLETTQSDYQDGRLDSAPSTLPATNIPTSPPEPETPAPTEPSPAMAATTLEQTDPTGADNEPGSPPPREPLLDGPDPIDVPIPREETRNHGIQTTPENRQQAHTTPLKPTMPRQTTPAPKPSFEPGFKGYQRKTAVTGSISRTGRSALDVADSPLGRYQAALSRAVEQEWQRNCVRHRDYITPGFLTVRFFVEPGGKVRSVQFVGDMATGEVQKGFTLNAIRDADIPAMPPALRKEYDQEPLELVFRFYF
jgi:hypothetical protein